VPGACALVLNAIKQLDTEQAAQSTTFARTLVHRASVANLMNSRPERLLRRVHGAVLKRGRQAIAKGFGTYAWYWMGLYLRGRHIHPEKDGRFSTRTVRSMKRKRGKNSPGKHVAFFNRAQSDATKFHLSEYRRLRDSQPWLGFVHLGLAHRVSPKSLSVDRVPEPGEVDVVPGQVSGPCASEMQKAMNRPGRGPKMKVDLRILSCRHSTETRHRAVKKTQSYTTSETVWVRDQKPRYKLQQRCEKVRVCKNLRVSERYWLPWRECLEKDIVIQRSCRDVNVPNGFDQGTKRKVTFSRKAYRTVTEQQAYEVHIWQLSGEATAFLGDQTFRYRIDVRKEDTDRTQAQREGQWAADRQLRSGGGKVRDHQLGQAATTSLDGVAKQLYLHKQIEPAGLAELARVTHAPAELLAAVFAPDQSNAAIQHREHIVQAPKQVDWGQRWGDLPPYETKRGRPSHGDPLTASHARTRSPLAPLREVEMEWMPNVSWSDVRNHRLWPRLEPPPKR